MGQNVVIKSAMRVGYTFTVDEDDLTWEKHAEGHYWHEEYGNCVIVDTEENYQVENEKEKIIKNLSVKDVMERYGKTKKEYNEAIRLLKKSPERMYDDLYKLIKGRDEEIRELKCEIAFLTNENKKFKKLYYDLYEEGLNQTQNKPHTPIISVEVKVDKKKSVSDDDERSSGTDIERPYFLLTPLQSVA